MLQTFKLPSARVSEHDLLQFNVPCLSLAKKKTRKQNDLRLLEYSGNTWSTWVIKGNRKERSCFTQNRFIVGKKKGDQRTTSLLLLAVNTYIYTSSVVYRRIHFYSPTATTHSATVYSGILFNRRLKIEVMALQTWTTHLWAICTGHRIAFKVVPSLSCIHGAR